MNDEPKPYLPSPQYLVYSDGRVIGKSGKELSQFLHRGYLCVGIDKRPTPIHRVLLWAFVGPRPEGMEGCHADDNKLNNDLSNLRWGTRSDNQQDAIKNGKNKELKKTHCRKGHELKAPNLVESVRYRKCKICHCTAVRITKAKSRKGIDLSDQFDVIAAKQEKRIYSYVG